MEPIHVKILIKGEENTPRAVRVELTSEANLFFHYVHYTDKASYQTIQETQRLMVDFNEYPAVLGRMLCRCMKEPQSYMAVLVMQKNGPARLDFIQNIEYKFLELLSCNFCPSPEEIVRKHITYRYNLIKGRMAMMQARLADVNAIVKVKNPSLLLHIQRVTSRLPHHRKFSTTSA
ncbi:hypothetical protein CBR_g9152 [Chara braunii]|uniref:Spindle assembly abnormal protein 6 N-terminal domain-containing protein n=1 Tax=Chara braunii TaxID=69332 RepID=A0A388KP81_CHABU|nr:hypothetical protein CBR_g9152 [Chara braunii]|eukprot:GBG71743.1 hypothetical protein CBR_g9152 [Chara braunii]